MKKFCIDASVIIACMSPDETSEDKKNIFLEQLFSPVLGVYAPAILCFEVATTLNRKINNHEITHQDATELFRDFYDLPIALEYQSDLMISAFTIKIELALKGFYDATYMALAKKYRIPLITNDGEVLKKAKKIDLTAMTADEWLG